MSVNTGGPAFPQHGWSKDPEVLRRMKDQGGMTLLDWMAGQALVAFVTAHSKDMHKQAIEDGVDPSDETYMPEFFGEACLWDSVPKAAYALAEAMLAEKAGREADHSGDANKMVLECGKIEFIPNHSPDATKMVALESANRELVEALELLMSDDATEGCDEYRKEKARAILTKHKGAA